MGNWEGLPVVAYLSTFLSFTSRSDTLFKLLAVDARFDLTLS